MDEREHHDEFYAHDATAIFDGPLFLEARRKLADLLVRYGLRSAKDRVLSLGCGDGRVECLMASRVGEIVGIELSSVAVKQARARAARAGLTNLSFEVGDIEELALPSASFDAIWLLGVLHHLSAASTMELLERCSAILRPGGIILSEDPSAHRIIGLFKALFRAQYRKYHSPDEHELDAGELANVYATVTFRSTAIYYSDFFLGPLSWMFPKWPAPLVRPLSALDSMLLAVPGLRSLASEFLVVARKPAT